MDNQVGFRAGQVLNCTRSEGDWGWFCPLFKSFFDVLEDKFAGIPDSKKHDDFNSILRDFKWSQMIDESPETGMFKARNYRGCVKSPPQ